VGLVLELAENVLGCDTLVVCINKERSDLGKKFNICILFRGEGEKGEDLYPLTGA